MNTRSVLSAKSWLTAICLLASACTPQATPVESSPTPSPAPVILALQQQVEGASLGEFFEASFQAIVMRSPEEVLETGLTDFYGVTDARLDDISAEYRLETYSLLAAIQAMLETYDREVLPAEEQVSYDIYHWYLEDQLAGQGFMYHEYPATYLSVVSVPGDIMRFFGDLHPIDSLQDARDYVARLQQVGTKIDQLIDWLEASQQAGIQPPEFAIQWAIHGELGALVVTPPTGTVFYTSLESRLGLLAGVSLEEKEAVLAEAEKAITDIVLPAYQALVDFMEGMEVYPAADSGIWRLPQGESYYDYLLRHFTTTAMSAEEVHQLGLDELDRIHTAMRVIFDALGYPQDETLVQLFDRVAEDGGWVPGQEALETYENLIANADSRLDEAFDIRPRMPVVVIPDTYGGFYIPGSVDGSRPGAFYAAAGGEGEAYYAMPTLAYHEAIPGHHLQIALALEVESLPSLRRGLTFTAFVEGWALYAEHLAWELGWYAGDPYGELGYLQAQAFRAARLVVDTGLHNEGWTFDQAQEFFGNNTGFDNDDIVIPQRQVARYLVWPGQATSYYIGFMKMLELRQRAMDGLGDEFDLKQFHTLLLANGSMPLEILEGVVDAYIQEELTGSQ